MFVGEVRCATRGSGISCRLSGGRKLSSGPTSVSKNYHVRSAIARSRSRSSAVSSSRREGAGRLSQ